jgi:hypothetical protein
MIESSVGTSDSKLVHFNELNVAGVNVVCPPRLTYSHDIHINSAAFSCYFAPTSQTSPANAPIEGRKLTLARNGCVKLVN